MTAANDPRPVDRRLDTWKEIAGFFRCDERTVKRWEAERGLPVHRYPGSARSKVYAETSELRAWLRAARPTDVPVDAPILEPAELAAPPAKAARQDRRKPILVAAACLLLASGAVVLVQAQGWRWPHAADAESRRVAAKPAPSPVAVELYLKGLHDWNTRSPAGLNRAVDEFTQAIVHDPDYAPPYVGLADCYNLLREYTLMAPEEAYPRAKAAAERAVALDDHLAGGHSALGFVDAYWSWDNAAADREFRRALSLDPKSAQAHHWYATFLSHLGRNAEASREIDQAQALDPSSSSILADKGLILLVAGAQGQAREIFSQLEATNPGLLSTHKYLADLYLQTGDTARYLAEQHIVAGLLHDPAALKVADAGARGARDGGGQAGMLRAMLAEQQALYTQDRQPSYALAQTSGRLGDTAASLRYLKTAVDRHEAGVAALRVDSAFDALRGDPAFRRLEARAGLPAT